MRYMMLIYTPEASIARPGSPEFGEMMAGYNAFGEEAGRRASIETGAPLMPTALARTVRVRDGKTLHADGPFAETKEQLGGFYIIDAKDEATALDLASKIPGAKVGSIEVRPVMEMS